MARLPLLIVFVVVALFVPSAAVAAPVDPVPGDWAAVGSASQARGARASVTFSVAEGTGLVVPAVDYRLKRCAGVAKRFTEKISLGSVAAVDGAFAVRNRHRHGKARVALRLRGVFDTETDAHGWVRGKVKFRAKGHRRAATCVLPKLAWSTSLAWDDDDEGFDEGDEGSDEDDDDFGDDEGEFDEDEGDPGDDEDVDPDEGP
jgi:hypothetical protein